MTFCNRLTEGGSISLAFRSLFSCLSAMVLIRFCRAEFRSKPAESGKGRVPQLDHAIKRLDLLLHSLSFSFDRLCLGDLC